ncbi:ethionine resistance protein [Entomophthora muscae]|uniref:Ethionine resistance protein n=1 Tax=Entomophthora muscae TaxID=34485 RepID=A0ACC2U362_9FUNG|nr:ethionine resistance protein [Entomophthora muscae]
MSSPPTESTHLLVNSSRDPHESGGDSGNSTRRTSRHKPRANSQSSSQSNDGRLKPSIYDGLNQHLGYNVTAPPSFFGTTTPDLGLKNPTDPGQGDDFASGGVDISSGYTLTQVGNECYFIFRMALPIVLSYILQNSIPLASVFSLGHLGPTELAASALSNMFATVTGWSVAMGMATALDTLCSQAFTGATDPHAVGIHLQRGILISLTLMIPVGILWFSAEAILLLLQLDPKLASFCGRYLRILLFGAPPYVIFECLKKFLQAQEIMTAPTYILISVVPINRDSQFSFGLVPQNYSWVRWCPSCCCTYKLVHDDLLHPVYLFCERKLRLGRLDQTQPYWLVALPKARSPRNCHDLCRMVVI